MIRHNYTLEKLTGEFRSLIGCEIVACFSQEKDSLVITAVTDENEHFLYFNADPNLCSIFLRPDFNRARKNTVDLFEPLIGKIFTDVQMIPKNRLIRFDLEDYSLYAILFGGAKSNLILVDSRHNIVEALNSSKVTIAEKYEVPQSNVKELEELPGDLNIEKALSKSEYLTGKYYAREICSRLAIDSTENLANINPETIDKLKAEAEKIYEECMSSQTTYILRNQEKETILSLIPLRDYPQVIRDFDTVSGAVQYRYVNFIKNKKFRDLYKELSKMLRNEQKKLQRNIENARDLEKSIERAEKYRHWAELLASQPNPKDKPGIQAVLHDWDGTETTIPLDEKLTLIENSEKYFDKARASQEDMKVRKQRLPELENKLEQVTEALEKIDKADNNKELEQTEKEVKQILGVKMQKDSDREDKFRKFELEEGYKVYAGKSAATNDELTMKFARPYDMWFHARGAGGSHVVLALDKNQQKPPKSVIKKAAAIAAYYSQARNAKYTPVAYTYKKYVRKPKGANPGSVTMSREDTVMVEPGLP